MLFETDCKYRKLDSVGNSGSYKYFTVQVAKGGFNAFLTFPDAFFESFR